MRRKNIRIGDGPRGVLRLLLLLLLAGTGLCLAAHHTAASPNSGPPTVTVTQHGVLTASNQSMFGPGGAAPPPTLTDTLFNTSWNASASNGDQKDASFDPCWPEDELPDIPSCWVDITFGGSASASSTGAMGLAAKLTNGTGGSVGVNYPVTVNYTLPKPGSFASGDKVTIQTSAALDTTQTPSITSVYPTYDFELDGTFGFTAGATGDLCFFACTGNFSLLPSVNIPTNSGAIFSLTAGQMNYLPGGFTGHCFDVIENAALGLGSVPTQDAQCQSTASNGIYTSNGYIFQPKVQVTTTPNADGSLTAAGCQLFMAIPISGVSWITRIFNAGAGDEAQIPTGFPNLGPFTFSVGSSLGSGDISLGYKAIDTAFTTTDQACQTLTFKPQINITLQFPRSLTYQVEDPTGNPVGGTLTGTSATFAAGDQIVITTTHDPDGPIQLTPSLSVASDTFHNVMTDVIGESAHLTVGVLNFSFPGNSVGFSGFDVGPVYEQTWPLSDTTKPVSDQTFALGGFNTPTLDPFSLTPDPRPVPTAVTVTPVEGKSFTGIVATFADADTSESAGDYTASIDWGDKTAASTGTVAGTGGQYSVSGTHTYAEEGTYTVTVTLTDADLPTNIAVASSTANVADAALTATPAANSTSPGGKPVLLWPASSPTGVLATFTDADPQGTVSDYSATIAWGDGNSSNGTVGTGQNGAFTVTGTHSYASLGFYTVTVQIADAGGSKTSATTPILTFAAPQSGNFAIGASNATLGASVTFWSAQWWKDNGGSGSAPAAFKGFAVAPTGPVSCTSPASSLSAGTGDSSPPPATVPTYMATLVADPGLVAQDGSAVSGPIAGVVVVQTNAGYGPDPGHAGTGTVVAGVCGKGG